MILNIIITISIAYILGSIPYGLVLVKIFKGIDLREVGSKNIGTTNVLRTTNKTLALTTLILDVSKGAIAVILCKVFINTNTTDLSLLAGFIAILGHLFPIWLNFKGGKGVATALGTILAISPIIGLLCLLSWLLIAIIFKYSSLAAISTFIMFPVYAYMLNQSLTYYAIFISAVILIKHKDNIKRLLAGQETKIAFKKKLNQTK